MSPSWRSDRPGRPGMARTAQRHAQRHARVGTCYRYGDLLRLRAAYSARKTGARRVEKIMLCCEGPLAFGPTAVALSSQQRLMLSMTGQRQKYLSEIFILCRWRHYYLTILSGEYRVCGCLANVSKATIFLEICCRCDYAILRAVMGRVTGLKCILSI